MSKTSTWPGQDVASGGSSFIVPFKAQIDDFFEIFGVELGYRSVSKLSISDCTCLEQFSI